MSKTEEPADRPLRSASTPDLLRRLASWKAELERPKSGWAAETIDLNMQAIERELRARGRLPEALL